jgi:hypothetical protein
MYTVARTDLGGEFEGFGCSRVAVSANCETYDRAAALIGHPWGERLQVYDMGAHGTPVIDSRRCQPLTGEADQLPGQKCGTVTRGRSAPVVFCLPSNATQRHAGDEINTTSAE